MSAATQIPGAPVRTNVPVFWQLCTTASLGHPEEPVDIDALRFRVGRRPNLEYTLQSLQISAIHAEFIQVGIRLFVRDLNSTNGTYVNGQRIGIRDVPLRDGDRVRMANVQFVIRRRRLEEASPDTVLLHDTVRPFRLPSTTPADSHVLSGE
jgi:pSer/pThr/pTyr-binding forkhead associated (FHA) protein